MNAVLEVARYPDVFESPVERFDHRRAFLIDAVRLYQEQGTLPFSTPGHKRGVNVDDELVEIIGEQMLNADVWLNMAEQDEALRCAEKMAAEVWQADHAYFLVNGSSSGNHAFMLACLAPGDEVIVARDMHKSLLTALILTGANPVFVAPRLHPELHLSTGVLPADIASSLDEHPRAKLVIVTSPTYHGVAADLQGIAGAAHGRNVPVFVDAAWGAHFGFHPRKPISCVEAGADACVVSCHKTLGSLSQASMLLVKGERIDHGRLASTVRMTQTTNRCLPILMSLDTARRQMALHGRGMMESTLALASWTRRSLRSIPGIRVIDHEALGLARERYDPSRLVIDAPGLGLSGCEVERILWQEYGIAPEMSDAVGVVCLITAGDTANSVELLVKTFVDLSRRFHRVDSFAPRASDRSVGSAIAPGLMVLTPREAFFAGHRNVPVQLAAGEIAAELVVPYPPGVPVLAPGERISRGKVEYLLKAREQGIAFSGSADPGLTTVRVVAN